MKNLSQFLLRPVRLTTQRDLYKVGISKAGPQELNGFIPKEFKQIITVDLVLECTSMDLGKLWRFKYKITILNRFEFTFIVVD